MALSYVVADPPASSGSRAQLSPLSPPSRALRPSNLREIDELVSAEPGTVRGVWCVQASADVLDALARHLERRAHALGKKAFVIDGLPTDDPWRELCCRVLPQGVRVASLDAAAAAGALVAHTGESLVVVRDDAPTQFGRALLTELHALDAQSLGALSLGAQSLGAPSLDPAPDVTSARVRVLVLGTSASSSAPAGCALALAPELTAAEVEVWWNGVSRAGVPRASASGGGETPRLDELEAWWSRARTLPEGRRAGRSRAEAPELTREATQLYSRLLLSRRSWLLAHVGHLGTAAAAQELVRANVLAIDARGALVRGLATPPEVEPTEDDVAAVAEALDDLGDPWAWARASELHARRTDAGAAARAEYSAGRAITTTADPSARADIWERWGRTIATFPALLADGCLLAGVDLALRSGDVERALALASDALALVGRVSPGAGGAGGTGGAGETPAGDRAFPALLALGRANVARGDVSTAACWLAKARAAADTLERGADAARSLVDVEIAEVRHMDGDMDGARASAAGVVASAWASASARLQARNVLGKVLLSQRAFSQAEAHFAADACEAAMMRDFTGELRARLNRAIALMSAGRIDEARSMLTEILAEAEAHGEVRAVAYALTNLASIATLKRAYAEALELSERAFDARRRLGDKVTLAMLITNLAELKLELGMVAEAEQALAFGRNACGPGMPGGRASHFAITAASIHLAKGRTAEARAELAVALGTAGASPHGARLGECWRLGARIALEDGDLVAARTALDRAFASAESPRERASLSILEASHARASGEAFAGIASTALEQAREAGDPELLREAHVLVHHAARAARDPHGTRAHILAAAALRDQVADALPPSMRETYLRRRDLAELRALEVRFGHDAESVHDAEPGRGSPNPSGGRDGTPQSMAGGVPALRRMTGRAPAMLALAGAVMKVGRSDATVLVQGESGTGKELVAEAIHEASARRAGPLVKVNCAALVETLLLSELFGHEKGSFTGAAARRRGRFEVAEGGTLFLDEIGDISARTQVALLRVLQDRTFERVGGVTPLRADVRIVCATHRDLPTMVSRGEFREDLYYRLRGVVLEVPPLRERVTDLPLIADAILERIADERGSRVKRLASRALDALCRHSWPGNVRELENVLRAAVLFAEGDFIEVHDLHDDLRDPRNPRALAPVAPASGAVRALPPTDDAAPSTVGHVNPSAGVYTLRPDEITTDSANDDGSAASGTGLATSDVAMSQTSKIAQLGPADGVSATEVAYAAIRAGISLSELKRDIERDCIARALAETGGNITRAAGLLGMKRPRLSQLVKQYGFGSGGAPIDEADAEDDE